MMGDWFGLPVRVLKLAVLVLLAALALIFIGYPLGRCQEYGQYMVMNRDNLDQARQVLAGLGHEMTPYDGIALGPLEERSQGTGQGVIRGRDRQGHWKFYVIDTWRGVPLKMQVYPCKPPAIFKEEKCGQ